MALNIIIKDRENDDEKLSKENAKRHLAYEYAEECNKGSHSHDLREFSKRTIKATLDRDIKGEDQRFERAYSEASKRVEEIGEKLIRE